MQRMPPNVNQANTVYMIPRGANMMAPGGSVRQMNNLMGTQECSPYQSVWLPRTTNVQYQSATNHMSYNSIAPMPYALIPPMQMQPTFQPRTSIQESRKPPMQYSLQPIMQQPPQQHIHQLIQQQQRQSFPLPVDQTMHQPMRYTMPLQQPPQQHIHQIIQQQQPSFQLPVDQTMHQPMRHTMPLQQMIRQPLMPQMVHSPIQTPMQHQTMQHQRQQPICVEMCNLELEPTVENYSQFNEHCSPPQYHMPYVNNNNLQAEFSSPTPQLSSDDNNSNDDFVNNRISPENTPNNLNLPSMHAQINFIEKAVSHDNAESQQQTEQSRVNSVPNVGQDDCKNNLEHFMGFLAGTSRNLGTFQCSEIKYEELIYLAVNGSSIAAQIASAHHNKPCFYQIENVCKRLMQDILRPDIISPQIEHQGTPWAVKDFIFVFTRIMNAWMIIKAYINNNHSGLNNIKSEFSDELKTSFLAWENSSLVFGSNLIKTFINLNNLVQKQKNKSAGNSNVNIKKSGKQRTNDDPKVARPIQKKKMYYPSAAMPINAYCNGNDSAASEPQDRRTCNVELNMPSASNQPKVASNLSQRANNQNVMKNANANIMHNIYQSQ